MAKQARTRNTRRRPTPYVKTTPYAKTGQMSLRTRRIIYVVLAVVVIMTMVLAAGASLFGGAGPLAY